MNREQKFYICRICGNIVGLINNAGVPLVCCSQEMEELIPNSQDAAIEKHVPEVSIDGDTINIQIGSIEHPMTEEHYISWVYLETKNGGQRKILKPFDKPVASFKLLNDEPLTVYAYCNIHGLWKKDL